MSLVKDTRKVLVHWIYTPEEWKLFRRWERSRLGWLRYLVSRFHPASSSDMAEVTITRDQVAFNGKGELFAGASRKLRRVHLRESGNINILEIFYQFGTGGTRVIRVPVPRGRLLQAIEVQECLSVNQ